MDVFKGFASWQLKGQKPTKRQTRDLLNGVRQNPSWAGSTFKCLRGLPVHVFTGTIFELHSRLITMDLHKIAQPSFTHYFTIMEILF